MLKIILFILLYLLIGCVCSLLFYLYTEDTDLIGVCILVWPFCVIIGGFYILTDSIEKLGDYIIEKRKD